MKKYGLIFFLCFAALLGCASHGAGDPSAQQNAEKIRYSDEDLDKIYHEIYDNKQSLSDLERQYAVRYIDALKITDKDGKELKSVVLYGETKYLYFRFNPDESVSCAWIKSLSPNSEEFDQFSVGDSFKKVMEFDPNGDYPFLYASWSGYPKISYHYTADEFLIVIQCTTDGKQIVEITKAPLS